MNVDRYTHAIEGIKAPDFLKKRTVGLLKAESSKSPNIVFKKNIMKKVVAIAAAVAVVGATTVFAEEIIRRFSGADGCSIQYSEKENERSVSIENAYADYAKVINEKLYFVLGDVLIDVTDECSDTSYYRYEIKNDDGSRNVILVGGTADNPGWIELIFDSEGKYVTNRMRIKGDDNWINQAMHNEGVPCGDPILDGLIREEQ